MVSWLVKGWSILILNSIICTDRLVPLHELRNANIDHITPMRLAKPGSCITSASPSASQVSVVLCAREGFGEFEAGVALCNESRTCLLSALDFEYMSISPRQKKDPFHFVHSVFSFCGST